jgi:hypothetical protein
MTIFTVLMPSYQPLLATRISTTFPSDFLQLNDTQWLVSTTGTAIDLAARLGVYDIKNPAAPATGNAVIFATSAYFGRAPTNVWDWMKAKLEATPSG